MKHVAVKEMKDDDDVCASVKLRLDSGLGVGGGGGERAPISPCDKVKGGITQARFSSADVADRE